MAARFAFSGLQLTTASGKPLSGGKIDFWENGTTTDKTTYQESALSTANANPLILDSNGFVPEAWSNDSDVYSIRILDSNDNVVVATIDDYSFVQSFSLSAADVLAALNGNTDPVVIDGSQMTGTAFAAFADALTLTAAGSINTVAGAATLGTVSGTPTFSGLVTHGDDVVSDTDSTDDLGTTSVRWANLFVDALTLTGGTGSFTIDDSADTGVADAFGNITAATTVDGTGIASVSSTATGVYTVVFDNAASATNKQIVLGTSDDSAGTIINTDPVSTTSVTVASTLHDGTSFNNFPIALVRYFFS